MEDIKQTVDKVMDDITAKRDEAMGKTEPAQAEQGGEHKKMDEITLKFGKGCVGEPFTGKDGKEYKPILIPNKDANDHSPWATFVARSNAVHEDKFGKGMWMKLPADGHTTVRKDHCVGEGADGKKIWETEKTKVTNRELKGMVEFYKTRGKEQEEKPRESLKDRLSEKKAEVSQQKHDAPQKTATKSKEASL